MLDLVEVSFDDVTAFVIGGIECWWSSTGCAASLPVGNLIGGFGYRRADSATPQQHPGRTTGICLIATNPVRAGARSTAAAAADFQVREQMLKYRAVVGLPSPDEHHQRPSVAVNEVMNLAGQPAAGTPNAMVRRLDQQILVIRPSPLCRG